MSVCALQDITGECRGCAEFQAQKERVPGLWRWVQSTNYRWQHQGVSAQPAILSDLHRSVEHLYHVLHDLVIWIMINTWDNWTSTRMLIFQDGCHKLLLSRMYCSFAAFNCICAPFSVKPLNCKSTSGCTEMLGSLYLFHYAEVLVVTFLTFLCKL